MSYTQLTSHQRYQIHSLLKEGFSQRAIADNIGFHPGTICRELRRNQGKRGYRPKQAHRFCKQRQCRAGKAIKLTRQVQHWLTKLIKLDLSPQQAVLYLRDNKGISLHHESVYQWI